MQLRVDNCVEMMRQQRCKDEMNFPTTEAPRRGEEETKSFSIYDCLHFCRDDISCFVVRFMFQGYLGILAFTQKDIRRAVLKVRQVTTKP